MIFMISLLTCCKTRQSMIEKSTIIETDTTTISRIADKDSSSLNAQIDSIIIEEYEADDQSSTTPSASKHKPDNKVSSCRKGNHTSQKETGSLKKKTKIYGMNLSDTWLSANYTLNKKMAHQQTTNSEVKQKTPTKDVAKGKNIYAIIAFAITLFVGYVFWKNAVQ